VPRVSGEGATHAMGGAAGGNGVQDNQLASFTRQSEDLNAMSHGRFSSC
jgi:hypothetical protein